jgi:hypothetical protein
MERPTTKELPQYAKLFIEGLKEAGVSVVSAVPESFLSIKLQHAAFCMASTVA